MKKSTLIVSAFIVSLGVFGSASTANAAEACNDIVISNTGAGSNNEGTCVVDVKVKVVCENNVYVLDENSQDAVSGAAETIGVVNGNTTVSGDATNENNTTVGIGASCGEAAGETTPATPTTPGTTTPTTTTPTTTGNGNGTTAKQTVAALPNTASNMTMVIVAAVAAVAVAALALSRVALAAYRRSSEK